jgi:hypothetical protein
MAARLDPVGPLLLLNVHHSLAIIRQQIVKFFKWCHVGAQRPFIHIVWYEALHPKGAKAKGMQLIS